MVSENKKKKILIIDDEPSIVEVLVMMLSDAGYEVEGISSGYTFETIKRAKPDLVLLDVWMSGIDGRKICLSIKEDNSLKDVTVYLVSASKDIQQYATEARADGYIEKPFEMQTILDVPSDRFEKNG